MAAYVSRRLLLALPSLLFVSLIIFSLVRVIPGDAVMARIAESGFVTDTQLHQMREQLGLDRSFVVQYLDWTGHAARGDFGRSLWTNDPVLPLILGRMQVSLEIAFLAIAVAVLVAIPAGILSAVRQDTWIDYVSRLFAILGLSVPDFWIATMLLLVLSKYVHWLPDFGWYSPLRAPLKNLEALIFPALIVGYRLAAVSARMMRSSLLGVLREDYIRTARAKGLAEYSVVIRHGLRNAMLPVLTIIGSQLTFLIGGLVIIEQVFSLPGQGRLLFDAITHRDYPVIQGSVMIMALLFVIANLAIDVSYTFIDPRIRLRN